MHGLLQLKRGKSLALLSLAPGRCHHGDVDHGGRRTGLHAYFP